jgi:hypothetical protein
MAHMYFADESVCLMADNVWNGVMDCLTALCFMVSSVVHVWEFVYDLSAVS